MKVLAENRGATFEAVFDSRKRKIPGPWKCGRNFMHNSAWTWAT